MPGRTSRRSCAWSTAKKARRTPSPGSVCRSEQPSPSARSKATVGKRCSMDSDPGRHEGPNRSLTEVAVDMLRKHQQRKLERNNSDDGPREGGQGQPDEDGDTV